ncbi:hypothetical protein [Kitasatospora azatica]|uniref:hypothetical protein n=1 Tax=Kitasatospora azatica TaxID=58347 RepID=UPI0005659BCD|nr:hypothetical protein [Kitasatospora azatica]
MAQQPGSEAANEPAEIHPFRDILDSLYHVSPMTVFWLVAASMGLGLVGAQVETLWMVVLFAVFWGITVVAMLVLAARLIAEHSATSGGGRHRRVAH